MYIITPKDHISQLLSYFSGPRTSGAVNETLGINLSQTFASLPPLLNKYYGQKKYIK